MRGHLVKRGSDSWSIVLYAGRDPQTGKKQYKWHSVKGTKKQAEKELASLINRLETGNYIKPNKITVGLFLEQWLKDYASTNTAPRTYERYAEIVRMHLIPNLGRIILTQLKPEHLQGYYAQELTSGRLKGNGGLSAQTVNHHHRVLSEALNHAVKWGLAIRNVASAVDPPRPFKREMATIQAEGIIRLLEEARKLEKGSSIPYYTIFYTALHTGMRRGELLALRWSDIELELMTISVNRSLQVLKDGTKIIREPKTPKARRLISMTPSLALQLREHKESQSALRLLNNNPVQIDDLIFSDLEGQPINPNTVTPAFNKIAKRAGLKIRLHDLRHTHATLMLKSGVHPKIVSERLGHATVAFTLDTYSHGRPWVAGSSCKCV
jgi:integrase